VQSTTTNKSDTGPATFREKWLNHRRFRFWVILLLLLYTVCGFFLLPAVTSKLVVSTLGDTLGREATLEKVRFNPFTLTLRASGFSLLDNDGTKLTGFEELLADFQLSSLINRAWTFKVIQLDNAYLYFERYAADDTRLSRLMADARSSAKPRDDKPSADSGLPRIRINELTLNEGRIDVLDGVPSSPVSMAIGPVNISVQGLTSLPDQYGQQSVSIQLPGDTRLSWQGNIGLAPFDSEGELAIENSDLHHTISYLQAVLPLESIAARMSVKTHYRVRTSEDGAFSLELVDLQAEVKNLAMSGLNPTTEFFTMPSLIVSGGSLKYPENEVRISSVRATTPGLSAWLDREGKLSLLALRLSRPTSSPSAGGDVEAGSKEPTAWKLGIDELVLQDGRANWSDNRFSPPGLVDVTNLQVRATNLSNQPGQVIPLELSGNLAQGGSFALGGDVVLLPEFTFSGQAQSTDIPLPLAQPYLQQSLNLVVENGTFGSDLEVAFSPGNLKVGGSTGVTSLHIKETIENENLIGWEQMDIDRFELDLYERTLQLSRVDIDRPFGRFKINPDRTTNLSGLSKAGTKQKTESTVPNPSPWSLVIGGIFIDDASLDFADRSLPLPFATKISGMDGTLTTISSTSTEPASIDLEGQVDEYGLARIEGTMSILDPIVHTDMEVEFRNLLLSNLSPYSAEFAGQKIDQGKLNLNLNYVIQDGKMQGGNKLVLSDLVLGDKVDNPEAPSLPLGLAVALLTDSEGVIDIDLPVEGDINNPEFRLGGVIWQAFSVLITKVVSAPFRLLGSLIGIDSEDLGQFQFLAGRSDLTAPEIEKISQLQQALQQRPELKVEISGPYEPGADSPELQFFSLREQVIARLGGTPDGPADANGMLAQNIRSILESLFSERFPEQPLANVKSEHTRPPLEDPQGKPELDELAYAIDLRDRLLASEVITRQDLENLANERAEAIRSAFMADGDFDASRVVIAAPVQVEKQDGEWVKTELGIAAE
jgi:uncharacterized protein involved in outer membrane biogenesis